VDRRLDIRVVAATHRDLRAEVAAGRFRQDLYFRLAGAVVVVPPLRERLKDLPLLAFGLLEDLARGDLGIAEATFTELRAHPWAGNVRELKNALACAVAFIEPGANVLEPYHLRLLPTASSESAEPWIDRLPLGGQPLERLERAAIKQTLEQTNGNKVRAAQVLGIAVSTLYEKMKKHGIAGTKSERRAPRNTHPASPRV
jgi:DNA-binding NtrC family response regulator